MYSTSEMAEKLGVSVQTLRNWDRAKQLQAQRKPSGRMFYTHEQYLEASGKKKYKKTGDDIDAIRGKIILMTGGSGSLAQALVPKICDYAKKVIVYSRGELKQHEMRQKLGDKKNIRYLIGDVRDKNRLSMALKDVDICIHAACMKRIEVCSYDPVEAVKSNVMGSVNVVEACVENGVKRALMVSTDKSSSPATLYGGTKFVSEQLFIYGNNYASNRDTTFFCVRYGNIFGSNGSIKHIFDKQAEDGVISITHPECSRFFMSLGDACDLILFANSKANGGEIFVPKMKAIKIMDFVDVLYPNIPKKIIGLRGHEKIHEELISETESRYVVKCNDKYYKIIPPSVSVPGTGWDSQYPEEKTTPPFIYTSNSVDVLTPEELKNLDKIFGEKYA